MSQEDLHNEADGMKKGVDSKGEVMRFIYLGLFAGKKVLELSMFLVRTFSVCSKMPELICSEEGNWCGDYA